MAKNADGKWHCPVTFKVFNDNSASAACASGHVYAYMAELNIKAKNWKDLMTDEPFKRADIIMLQDPIDEALKSRRDIANFSYLKQRATTTPRVAATPASAHIRATPGTARRPKRSRQAARPSGATGAAKEGRRGRGAGGGEGGAGPGGHPAAAADGGRPKPRLEADERRGILEHDQQQRGGGHAYGAWQPWMRSARRAGGCAQGGKKGYAQLRRGKWEEWLQ